MATIDQAYKALLPDIEQLEAYRVRKRRIIKINQRVFLLLLTVAVSIYILVFATQYFTAYDTENLLGLTLLTVIIGGIVAFIIYAVNKMRYEKFFKEKIVPAMVPGVTYNHDDHISMELFRKSGFFNKQNGQYLIGQDHFSGETSGMKFELSWLKNQSRTEKSYYEHKGKTSNRYNVIDIFSGIFMFAKQSNRVTSPIYIFPTFQEIGKVMKGLVSRLNIITNPDAPEIKIGNSEFEKKFTVFSENSNEAKKIVTSQVVAHLVDCKDDKPNLQFFVAYVDDNVFVAIDQVHRLFEPKISKSLLEPSAVEHIFKDLLRFLNILRAFVKN